MFTFIYIEDIVRGLKIVMALTIAVPIVFRQSYVAVLYDLCFVSSASRSTAVLPKHVA